MVPWEREVYVAMLIEHLKKKAENAKQRQKNGTRVNGFKTRIAKGNRG